MEIPEGVTSIGELAFYGSGLTSISIPEGVTSIERDTFYDCLSLESVAIPDSVTSIAASAFGNCTSLTTVYYGGTDADWVAITVDSSNDCLLNADIQYAKGHAWNDGEVTKAATCTEAGVMTYTCTVCDNTYTEAIPATGHKWSSTPTSWEWADDYSSATAIWTCQNDKTHTREEEATITISISGDTATYTAYVLGMYYDVKEVTIEGEVAANTGEGNVVEVEIDVEPGDLLTSEEAAMVAAGGSVEFVLDVTDATVAEEIAAIDACAEDLSGEVISACYLEIDLTKYVTDADGTETTSEGVTETNVPLTITVEIPEALLAEADAAGLDGEYVVIRYHDGAAETLDTEYDAENNTVTFQTDKFSTYAIVYVAVKAADTVSPEASATAKPGSSGNGGSNGSGSGSDSGKKSPSTGDEANLALWAAVLALCGAGMCGLLAVRKKKNQ